MNAKLIAAECGLTDEKEIKLLERITSNERVVCLHAIDQSLTDTLCGIIKALASKMEPNKEAALCACGHPQYDHTVDGCWNGSGHGNRCVCRDFQKQD